MLEIDGKWCDSIVDTVSSVSIIQPGVSRRDMSDTSIRPFGVTDETLHVKGQKLFSLRWEYRNLIIGFWYVPSPPKQQV